MKINKKDLCGVHDAIVFSSPPFCLTTRTNIGLHREWLEFLVYDRRKPPKEQLIGVYPNELAPALKRLEYEIECFDKRI